MAKETEPKTYRVSPEVHADLQRLAKEHGGVDKALRALLAESTVLDGPGAGQEIVRIDPATIPGVSRGVPAQGKEAEAVHEKAFRVMCQHCGVKFGAEARKETTCEPCAQKGHKGSRYDCEECRLES